MELGFIVKISLIIVSLKYLADKLGIINWYNLHRLRWMPTGCNFCLFWWSSVLCTTAYFLRLKTTPNAIEALCTCLGITALALFIYKKQ